MNSKKTTVQLNWITICLFTLCYVVLSEWSNYIHHKTTTIFKIIILYINILFNLKTNWHTQWIYMKTKLNWPSGKGENWVEFAFAVGGETQNKGLAAVYRSLYSLSSGISESNAEYSGGNNTARLSQSLMWLNPES